MSEIKVVANGAGAAGIAIIRSYTKLWRSRYYYVRFKRSHIRRARQEGMNNVKAAIAEYTNRDKIAGSLADVIRGTDVFIGVSVAGALTKEMVSTMNSDPIIFAMANPDPEIMPDDAKAAGAKVVGTGRSDFPNQVNNVLAFPGIFQGSPRCTRNAYK